MERGVIVPEFETFIIGEVIPYVTASPPVFFGLIGILLLYFGYLFNEPTKIKQPTDRIYDYISGLVVIFGYISTYMLLILFIPVDIFKIDNSVVLTFFKILILFYAIYVIIFSTKKINRHNSSFFYNETDYVRNYLKVEATEELADEEFSKLLLKLCSDRLFHTFFHALWLLIYRIFFEWICYPLLIIFSTIIFLSDTSMPVGIIIFGYIFLAISLYTRCKGITERSYLYAEIYLENEKTYIGRLKALDNDFIHLLTKENMKNYYPRTIPINKVEKIEFRSLQDILALEKLKK